MADSDNKGVLTRTWWAGTGADTDIHIEAYEGDIDGTFGAQSLFRSQGLTTFKSVANQTNSYRFDRVGGAAVQGRVSGEKLESTRIVNEKAVISVEAVSYVRTVHDFQDDWTAPDFHAQYAREHGVAHAKSFDTAHITQLIQAGYWQPPASLTNFSDGIHTKLTGFTAATNSEDQAEMIVQAHKDMIRDFINRDLGSDLGSFVTLVTPEFFSILLDYDRLMNVDFQGGEGGNNFVRRRIAWLNGQQIIETPRFPKSVNPVPELNKGKAGTGNYPGFTLTAEQVNTGLIMYDPAVTLITLEAHPMEVRWHDDETDWESYLTSFDMYTVGIRRGDACGVLVTDAAG